jgi:hypothetical protein
MRKLVDSEREHALLEALLEASKPPLPGECRGLHFLLATPFRYPPLPHGSRFGRRDEPGIWYGSETIEACFAEVAYYRFLFLEGSRAALEPLAVELSAFQASLASSSAVDLVAPPFDRHRARIASPVRYGDTQRLGTAMRTAGVELFRYPSARWKEGVNVGLFTPRAFARKTPSQPQSWHCFATRSAIELVRKSHFERSHHRYERSLFEVRGVLPSPAA